MFVLIGFYGYNNLPDVWPLACRRYIRLLIRERLLQQPILLFVYPIDINKTVALGVHFIIPIAILPWRNLKLS